MTPEQEKQISDAGHGAMYEAEALSKIVANLHSTNITVAELILNGMPRGLHMQPYRERLAMLQKLNREHPTADFIMLAQRESFAGAVEYFASAVSNAEKYAHDRKR